jgi:adenine-specific DNA glycosylase
MIPFAWADLSRLFFGFQVDKIGAVNDKQRKYPMVLSIVKLPWQVLYENFAMLARACKSIKQTEEIKHVFTHRRLWMQIWQANSSKELTFLNPDLNWVPLNQLGRYGLPQPIKILLQSLSLVRDDDLKN